MDWYAPIARHLFIPLLSRRDGCRPGRYLREIAAWERLAPGELAAQQWRKAEAIIRHAAATSPYYRRLFAERGLEPDDLDAPRALARLPVLTKDLARARKDEIRSEAFPDSQLLPASTGGTTGLPLAFYRDRDCRDKRVAARIVFDRWYGFRPGDRVALAWGASQDIARPRRLRTRMRVALENRPRILNAAAMTRDDLAKFAQGLARSPVRLLRGYASVLEALAQHLAEHGLSVTVPAIVSTAEPLTPEARRTIGDALRGEVFDEYSTRECGLMATECGQHDGLHVNASSVLVEVLVGERPAEPGEPGRVVVTDLDNYAFPLLRYEVGDLARWALGECPCGRTLPRLAALEGRAAQVLYGTGDRMAASTALSSAFGDANPPAQIQLVQERAGAILVRLVPREGFGREHEAAIAAILRRALGDDLEIAMEQVTEVERAPSGKYLFAISRLHEGAHAEARP